MQLVCQTMQIQVFRFPGLVNEEAGIADCFINCSFRVGIPPFCFASLILVFSGVLSVSVNLSEEAGDMF